MRRLDSVAVFSRFAGKQAFGEVLRRHINWSANYIDRGGDLRGTGMQKEELKEVIEELRSMTEAYSLDAYDQEGEQNDGV
ncbi:hypothetical protein CPB86DRAFT_782944 [Serendipita vermifera]|nr:hypothetical protein CPB86DRAFT_782944 [Serendipita vermifera]